jgi:archaellum component FlaF (FlaF/FlaG flagellin family)
MAYTEKQKIIPTNVNYTSKDFSTIKADLIEYTKSYFPDTYKDFNETSPGMMLIELSSYVGDVLSYYIDYNYKENLLSTATEKRNIRRLAEFLGYKTPNKTPSVVRLKVETTIDADTTTGEPKYGEAPASIDSGLQITSNVNSETLFETTGEIDFTASGSGDPEISAPILDSNGEASSYTLTRYVRAVSGQTKTKSFNITSPTKFLELDLEDDNVIEILNCVDSAGQKWYEVDYLAQEKALKQTHYSDSKEDTVSGIRVNAYDQGNSIVDISPVPVPYVVEYIKTDKKFTLKFDEDTKTYKVNFGNGLFRFSNSGSNVDNIEQAGVTINGVVVDDVQGAIGSTTSNNLNLGETPTNTTLTFTYRAGGGADSNVQVDELTTVNNAPSGVTITVTNDEPSVGGTDGQTVDEIRNNASAFFASQLRCVTKEDYTARILSLPQKFGSVAKVYVERLDGGTLLVNTLSYNQSRQLVQTPQLILQNIATYINNFRMINDIVDFGFQLDTDGDDVADTLFSGYLINFGVHFKVNYDRRFNPTEVKLNIIDTIKDFFKIEKMQFRQSINMNDLQYNILGLDGVIGIKELKLFQDGNNEYATNRKLYSYQGNGDTVSGGESNYGFQYNFENALQDGVYRPSISPAVFELRNPNKDIYGKVI